MDLYYSHDCMQCRIRRKAASFLREASRTMRYLAILLCLAGVVSFGQVRTTGILSGTVVDPSGAAVPNASVTVTEPSTGFTQTVTASGVGDYSFTELQPGQYQLTCSAPGFANAVYSNIVIEAARTVDLQVQMKVGAASQSVEVSAQGQVLETSSNTLATTINPESVQNLPLNGRDLLPMAELVAGAQAGGDQRFTTYNALPNGAINISIDGINANSQRFRTSTTGFFTFAPIRLGAFDELTVSTSDLTADAGAEGSATVRFVTKRGTNEFHGNVFWEARNSFFNANTFTNNALGLPTAQENLNDFGGSLGGPFWRNHIFFFVNYEQLNEPGQIPTTLDIPTPQVQSGLFSYIGTDGATHSVNLLALAAANGFPSTLNPVTGAELSKINGYAGAGTVTPVPGLPYEEQLSFLQHTNTPNKYPTTRLDWQITQNVAYHGSWDLYWRNIANTEVYPGDTNLANGYKSTYYVASNAFDWTMTPHLLNQVSFGIQSNVEEFNPGNSITAWQGQGNVVVNTPYLANGTQVYQPLISTYGTIPQPRNNPLWNIFDNLTWTHENHTFTFGGDLRLATMHETEVNPPVQYYLGLSSLDPALGMFTPANFPSINTGNGNQDLINAEAMYATLTGRINYISGLNDVNSITRQFQNLGVATDREAQTVGGIYFQDAWRMTPHFALNYGLRWQFTGAIHSTDNLWPSPDYADLLGPSNGLFQPGILNSNLNPTVNLRPNPYPSDFKQPSPNLGFAWNPNFEKGFLGKLFGGSKTVIRGGASISRYDEGWTTAEQATIFGNPGVTQSVYLYPGFGSGYFTPGSLSLGASPTLNTVPNTFSFPLSESAFTFADQPFSTIDPHIRPPYVEQWNFGIQRQLAGNTVLEVNYVGNHSVHMWMNYDLNETNIFENGFLNEFVNAQHNLAANGGTTFADNTGAPGLIPLPIFDAAFGGAGSAPGSTNVTSSFTNPNFITLLQQGQAGTLANQLATSPTFLCNMVGNGNGRFSVPCAGYGPGKYPINFFQVNPYAAGSYVDLLSDPGSESYNGLQVQVKHPVGHGLMFMANYTYSHAFTNRFIGDYYTSDEALENFITLRDPGLNRGPSPYDLRHVFRTFVTYDLPFGPGKMFDAHNGFINRVIGGWTLGTIVTVQTGRPFKLLSGYDTFNYSNAFWPDATDSGVVLNGISRSQLQNQVGVYNGPNSSEPTTVFPQALLSSSGGANPSLVSPPTTPGELGSMIFLYGPMYWNVDASVHKSIPLAEHVSLNIWAEFLNAFNHPNWTVLDNFSGKTNGPAEYANITSNSFSGLSLANADGLYSRNIQFRVQLSF